MDIQKIANNLLERMHRENLEEDLPEWEVRRILTMSMRVRAKSKRDAIELATDLGIESRGGVAIKETARKVG